MPLRAFKSHFNSCRVNSNTQFKKVARLHLYVSNSNWTLTKPPLVLGTREYGILKIAGVEGNVQGWCPSIKYVTLFWEGGTATEA